uniref:Transposase n=1 Tax=Steinernema glaseri TaxID=37863 RepID=A0A1I8AVY9_9BILA
MGAEWYAPNKCVAESRGDRMREAFTQDVCYQKRGPDNDESPDAFIVLRRKAKNSSKVTMVNGQQAVVLLRAVIITTPTQKR